MNRTPSTHDKEIKFVQRLRGNVEENVNGRTMFIWILQELGWQGEWSGKGPAEISCE
jgi:hypothetical protein